MNERRLVIYDGQCAFCAAGVCRLERWSKTGMFAFMPSQSEHAREAMRRAGLHDPWPQSIVLIEAGRAFTHSAALRRIARRLRWPWQAGAWLLAVVPRPWADAAYGALARNRYRWCGAGGCDRLTPGA